MYGEEKIICQKCKNENPKDSLFCGYCGEKLSVNNIDKLTIKDIEYEDNKKIVCPICHIENSEHAEQCVNCGQRLKIKQTELMEYNNKANEKKHFGNRIFFILIIFVLLFSVYRKQALAIVYKVAPQKVVAVGDMSTYINQNENFQLPSQIAAKMNYGDNQALHVDWESKTVESSTVGTKVIKGKIKGYDKDVKFSVNVLPNPIHKYLYDYTALNSMLELDLSIPKDIKWIWFKISKDGKNEDEDFTVKDGEAKGRVYLPFGDGDYEISALTTTNDDEYGNYYLWQKIDVNNKDTRDTKFLLPTQYVQSDSEKIRNLAYKITDRSITDYEKTKAIHDWVATNISYDVAELKKPSIHTYSAIETLGGKTAVCNGYANLTAALNRAIGIKTKIIIGTAKTSIFDTSSKNNSHAWNESFINGNWLIQDTTWDAGVVDETTDEFQFSLSHKYFNPSVSSFSVDHTKTEEK